MSDPTSLPNFPPLANEHPLRGRVLDALIDLDLRPDIDSDGDVAFMANEQQLFVRCTEGDLEIMRIFGQWQLPAELGGDVAHALHVCNEINLALNCVKTGVANNTLVVTSEHFMASGGDLSVTCQVGIQAVLSAVHHWHQRALGLEEGDEAGSGGEGGM